MKFNLITALKELQKERGISAEELYLTMEAALISAYRKNYDFDGELLIEVEEDGKIAVKTYKTVVAKLSNPEHEITFKEAQSIANEVEVNDQIKVDITPRQFGRVAAQTAKQVISQKMNEVDRKTIYDKYSNRINELIIGKIQRFDKGDILVELDDGVEAIMPLREQIPSQRFRQGDRIKSVIIDVRRTSRGPQIALSRTHPEFLQRLFEQEIPEIPDKLVEIKSIAREPGVRSKIAVYSAEDHIDAVGSCVGLRGSRIQVVVNELFGEKIDIVKWNEDLRVYIANALSPAKPNHMEYIEDENRMFVVVPDQQLSLAIGKEGQNVRLSAKLAHIKIDIVKESDYIRSLNSEGQ
ncbi:MAG: transcription termination factor NusA [bacterium]|nr:transcription termination factor NusA [bacterium]